MTAELWTFLCLYHAGYGQNHGKGMKIKRNVLYDREEGDFSCTLC